MARGHPGLPPSADVNFSKRQILKLVEKVDASAIASKRVLALETEIRKKVKSHIGSLPAKDAAFSKFGTNPFVLMIHCCKRDYSRISEIENDILPAKEFSSMETSAGKMIEAVALPAYGWDTVPSGMHTANSALDGRRLAGVVLYVSTLKSGPRCINDEMSENFADSIVSHAGAWAREAGVKRIDFTFGVLYGTPRMSNKKDWHILRNVAEKVPQRSLIVSPTGRWECAISLKGVDVQISVRIGADWWNFLGGQSCLVELCIAMIRACVRPGEIDPPTQRYTIADLSDVVSLRSTPETFNVRILQRSQLPWMFFLIRHFCDQLSD